jgi:hypothetical protein
MLRRVEAIGSDDGAILRSQGCCLDVNVATEGDVRADGVDHDRAVGQLVIGPVEVTGVS